MARTREDRQRIAMTHACSLDRYTIRRFDLLRIDIAKEFPEEDDCFVAEQSLKIVLAQHGKKAREALREKMKNGGVERVPMIEAEPIVEATVIPDDLPPLQNRAIEEFGDVIGRADERQAIQIAKKLLPFSNITPEQLLAETDGDAPTAIAAWGLLYFARQNKTGKENFLYKIYPKVVPTEAQIKRGEEFADDGRETLGLIRRLQKARLNTNPALC